MKANYEDKIAKQTTEIAMGNLYDVNKQLMATEKELSAEERFEIGKQLEAWLDDHFDSKYFMLLCHERRDYTVFNLDKTSSWKRADPLILRVAREDILECLTNRGELISACLQEDGAWEFWIKDILDGCFAYYFFPYGDAVLEY